MKWPWRPLLGRQNGRLFLAPPKAQYRHAPNPIAEKKDNQRIVLISGLAAAIVVIGVLVFFRLRPRPIIGENQYQQQTAPPAASQSSDLKPSPAQPPRLTTEELFKQASPSVVLIQVFNSSGLLQ